MEGIAQRRANRARLRKKRCRYWWGRRLTAKEAAMVVDTPTPCSCWMCGNPRRHWKKDALTIWEKRWFQEIKDEQE